MTPRATIHAMANGSLCSEARRSAPVLGVLVLAMALIACGASVTATHGGAGRHAELGTIVGEIVSPTGAPPPPGYRPPGAGGIVSVFTPRGKLVARQGVRPGHHFAFTLAPGRYKLTTSPRLTAHLRRGQCLARVVVVHARVTAHVQLLVPCGIPVS